jgi:Transcription factor TFIIH complex subunit Tfb5
MVRAIKGCLVKCDSAVKQIILEMDKNKPNSKKIVIEDLDVFHLVVCSSDAD